MEPCFGTQWAEGPLGKIELLNETKRKLDEARNLATEAGGFTLFYLIEMALLETKEMTKNMERSEREDSLAASSGVNSQILTRPLSIGGFFITTKPAALSAP